MLSMEPLAAHPETPVKFKSMQQLYVDNVDDSSTETDDDLDGMQEVVPPDEWSDSSSDSQEGEDDEEELMGKKKVAFGKLVRRKEMSITQNRVFETSYVMKKEEQKQQSTTTTATASFKTLAQLIDPRSNERVKCCTRRRKTSLAKKITARRANYRLGPRPLYVKRCKPLKQLQTAAGTINLVVDLVFQRNNEGAINLSSSGSTVVNVVTPEADGSSTKLSSQGSVDQDRSLSPDQEEEECNVFTVRDPNLNCLSATWNVASACLPSTVEQLKWREVDVGDVDPSLLLKRACKVYGPLENRWYKGFIHEYDERTKKYRVEYSAGKEKWQLLAKERLALYISLHDKFKLIFGDADRSDSCQKKALQENLLVLAASTEDLDDDFGHADIVWAEVTGYPFWPAFVMDEDHAKLSGPEMDTIPGTLAVFFFGSHECARVNCKRVVGFSKGLRRDYHLKCNRVLFDRALEELDRYFVEGKLPKAMSHLQGEPLTPPLGEDRRKQSDEANENDEDFVGDERKYKVRKSLDSIFKCPIKLGSLRILSLGKIVKDSEYFHDQQYIWTEGYTATRRFFSTKDPSKIVLYKMEILKNPIVRTMPLFRVTPEDGDQVEGPSAAACWKKIFDRLQKARGKVASSSGSPADKRRQYRSGASMFGLAHPRVSKLIQSLPYARVCSKFKGWAEETAPEDVDGLLPAGFKHVGADLKHLDRCSVCYTNEEYEGNVLLQCDKCRMLVHLNCYGVLEAPGDSWLCNLCDANAPKSLPLCCLCPILGGAMKRTTDGRWVHLACALWIPETCCVDMDRMEPIDGIQSINKERWKLTCTICSVPYGACIQCADHHCRVAYHPLCARAAGFSTKVLEGLRRKRNRDTGIQEEERSVQLLSYCKKHMQSGRSASKPAREATWTSDEPSYPFHNISGCARSEAYNVAARRGRREPEHCSAALAKRGFLENRPYVVTGCLRWPYKQARRFPIGAKPVDVALSTSERFNQMRSSLHQRLTFGKSAIHGWGLFAKLPHEAGDMVIEYAGEVIRPVVADDREKRCYNSLVGAGTYMFCIDNERVVDATRAGSIAHLINHSCEPNCYSRVVAANGKERIIIFAKQDIAGGEEVTYDYRFTSIGEQLACHCGTAGCRGIVNVMDEEDESGRILVNVSEITRWQQQ